MSASEVKLAIEDVSLKYAGARGVLCALEGVTLEVASRQSVAIIGPSGCGKSSLLKIACGLIHPTSGTARIDGNIIEKPRKETSLVLQDFGLLPWKRVIDNCALGLKIRGVGKRERSEAAQRALARVQLEGFEQAFPAELSGGMKQRLAIARALAYDIDLLLLDEPLSALDALLREEMQDMLLNLWMHGSYAQVLVTHSIEEAVFLGQRILIMGPRPGSIVQVLDNPCAGDVSCRRSAVFHEMCDCLRSALGALKTATGSDEL